VAETADRGRGTSTGGGEPLLAERRVPGQPLRIADEQLGAPVAIQVEPLRPGARRLQVRQRLERPKAVPAIGVAIVLVEAALSAVQHGEVDVAVAIEVGQRALAEPVGGTVDHQALGAKAAPALVGREVPRRSSLGKNARQALAVQIDPAVGSAIEAAGQALASFARRGLERRGDRGLGIAQAQRRQ
jgi:hypothetical protein